MENITQNLTENITQSINQTIPFSSIQGITQYYFPQGIRDYLHQPLINLFGIPLDYWSILHLIIGYLLGYIILRAMGTLFSRGSYYAIVGIALTGFEIFEYYLVKQGLARPETIADTIGDILIGMIGAFAADVGIIILIIAAILIGYFIWRRT